MDQECKCMNCGKNEAILHIEVDCQRRFYNYFFCSIECKLTYITEQSKRLPRVEYDEDGYPYS